MRVEEAVVAQMLSLSLTIDRDTEVDGGSALTKENDDFGDEE